MKKLFTLCFITAMAISATAQTKEETIDWLITYSRELTDKEQGTYFSEINKEGNMVIKWHSDSGILKSNLKDNYWFEDIEMEEYAEGRYRISLVPKDELYLERMMKNGLWVGELYFDNEQSCKRVYNALTHLAKLLGTKPKPKKNTF